MLLVSASNSREHFSVSSHRSFPVNGLQRPDYRHAQFNRMQRTLELQRSSQVAIRQLEFCDQNCAALLRKRAHASLTGCCDADFASTQAHGLLHTKRGPQSSGAPQNSVSSQQSSSCIPILERDIARTPPNASHLCRGGSCEHASRSNARSLSVLNSIDDARRVQ